MKCKYGSLVESDGEGETGREIFPIASLSTTNPMHTHAFLPYKYQQKYTGIGLAAQIGSWNSLAHIYGIMLLVFHSNGMIELCYAWV